MQTLRQLLARQIDEHGIVVWYDPDAAYASALDKLNLDDVRVFQFTDTYFRLRAEIEPLMEWIGEDGKPIADREVPPRLLLYIPRPRSDSQHALVEAETAGIVVEPGAAENERNTRLAVLAERVFTRLAPEKATHYARQTEEGLLTFADLENMAGEAGAGASGALKLIFGQASPIELILAFLSDHTLDTKLMEKKGLGELRELLHAETGFAGQHDAPEALRDALANYLLLMETAILMDLPEIDGHTPPEKPVLRDTILHIGSSWRNRFDLQEAYAGAAAKVDAVAVIADASDAQLATLETFVTADRTLIQRKVKAISAGEVGEVGALAKQRKNGFWSRLQPDLLLQWSLVETAAELLTRASEVTATVRKRKWALDELIQAYTAHAEPWMRVDTLARHLESRYARFFFEAEVEGPAWEPFMARCRTAYLNALEAMAEAYSRALETSGFTSSLAQAQTGVFKEMVAPLRTSNKRTVYLLVDAFRYEMAVEWLQSLGDDFSASIQPSQAQLPGITPVGMAALMPGAENGLVLGKHGGKLQVMLGDRNVRERAARMDWLKAKTDAATQVVKLKDVQRITPKKKKMLADASLLVVTSQEIDRFGEEGEDEDEARVYMDEVLERLRRGVRNLATIGFTDFVVAADHGYIFAEGLESGLKMDAPGGDTVELHARCWIGRGGSNGDGFFRVPASALELGGGLECAFPRTLGTFKIRGGVGSYFHGGASLQEQVIPVIHLKAKTAKAPASAAGRITLQFARQAVTNRVFSITATLEQEEMFAPEPITVQLEVNSGKSSVGHALMAAYGFDEASREILLEPGRPNAVTIMLSATNDLKSVSLRLLDSKTDKPLMKHPDLPVRLAF